MSECLKWMTTVCVCPTCEESRGANKSALSGRLSAEFAEVKEKYNELLMAVQSKSPGETRHETALRYIRNAEIGNDEACEEAST